MNLTGTAFSADLGGSSKIPMRTLKTEVEKGFMSTAFGHELLGPKARENSCDGTAQAEREYS